MLGAEGGEGQLFPTPIQGDLNGISEYYMKLAKSVYNDIEKYRDISIKKISEWIKLDDKIKKEDFIRDSINCSNCFLWK
jgi:hypothetical protein